MARFGGKRPFGGAPDPESVEVRHVQPYEATKTYRCPGCDHEIQAGVAHVVVWPADELGTIADRRHWHLGCWQARGRRRPTRKR